MPVFNQNARNRNRNTTTAATQPPPAWLNTAAQYVNQNNNGYNFNPGYGQTAPTSGTGTIRRGRGAVQNGVSLQAPTNAPQTMSGQGTIREARGATVGVLRPQAQTYVANPQTYTNPQTPAWLQTNPTVPGLGGMHTPQQAQQAAQQLAAKNEKPYRIQNADGSWAYLQTDGTYMTATGTAGRDDIIPHNSYTWMPPFQQLQPPDTTSPFSSNYSGWGRRRYGRGGGGGYGGSGYTPAWMMGLNSWNFGE